MEENQLETQAEGIRKLAISLISSALIDLKKPKPLKLDALMWFNERSQFICGYGWCLQMSGGNPNIIRKSIIERIGPRGKSRLSDCFKVEVTVSDVQVITEWMTPETRTKTMYGMISNQLYLVEEKARIEAGSGRECRIRTRHGGEQRLEYIEKVKYE